MQGPIPAATICSVYLLWRSRRLRTKPLRAAVFLALGLLIAAPKTATAAPAIPATTADAVTHHSLVIDGQTINYTARAGTITLRNGTDQPTARVFYPAYTRDGVDSSKRPVTFFWNGGPGSSTIWLRMGSFGPVRVQTADGGPDGTASV